MVVIEIKNGKLRGKACVDRDGNEFYSFQNIPYAAPPLGSLRFKAPQPPESWIAIRDATKEGNESVSRHMLTKKIVGSEDCLNLNVYTPQIPKNEEPCTLRPVMFWIHGGILMTGSNKTELFGPEFLMPEDVVLVTINYRLGILGFLSLEDPTLGVPGNAGFKDMVMALKWVQNNIKYFSGDPNNVTIFGQSAGAASAHLLMLSPMAKGLFHKIIAQSACALNSWVFGRRSGRLIAKQLGFNNWDDRKILAFLRDAPAKDILKAQLKLDIEDFMEYDIRLFGAVVERFSDEEPFLTEYPSDIIESGNYNQVPIIMGYNLREGMAYDSLTAPKQRVTTFVDMELSVPLKLNIERGSDLSKDLGDRIQRFYFGDEVQDRNKHIIQYYDLCTDKCFLKDIYFSVKKHVWSSYKPVYFYQMSLDTELNVFKRLSRINVPGAYHGDEIGYLFKTKVTPDIVQGSIEDISQKRIRRLWANFARCGNPTPDEDESFFQLKWKPCEPNELYYLDIGEQLSMKVNPEPERMTFWSDLAKINPAAKL